MMSTLLDYEPEDLGVYGEKDIKKFILGNYTKFSVYKLAKMLSVTPEVIHDTLTRSQLQRAGRMASATVLIIRDIEYFSEDAKRFEDAL